ncbi:MAG: hypothetical protein QXT35_01110 [Conexivisphaerales archaeon]
MHGLQEVLAGQFYTGTIDRSSIDSWPVNEQFIILCGEHTAMRIQVSSDAILKCIY